MLKELTTAIDQNICNLESRLKHTSDLDSTNTRGGNEESENIILEESENSVNTDLIKGCREAMENLLISV